MDIVLLQAMMKNLKNKEDFIKIAHCQLKDESKSIHKEMEQQINNEQQTLVGTALLKKIYLDRYYDWTRLVDEWMTQYDEIPIAMTKIISKEDLQIGLKMICYAVYTLAAGNEYEAIRDFVTNDDDIGCEVSRLCASVYVMAKVGGPPIPGVLIATIKRFEELTESNWRRHE